MARTRSSSSSMFWWMAGVSLVVAALYAWLSTQPAVPPDGGPVFYPALILYTATASAVAITVLLVAVLVLGFWLPLALARKRQALVSSLAVILALAASGLACWG